MPAPTLAILQNLEGQITFAARQILAAGGFPEVQQRGSNTSRLDAYTAVTVDLGAATGRLGRRPEGTTEHVQFSATLAIAVAVARRDNEPEIDATGTPLDRQCATIRALFLNHPNRFAAYQEEVGVYVQVNGLKPLPAVYNIDTGTEADMRILNWELVCTIPDLAWPAEEG